MIELPCCLSGKESACNIGETGEADLIPGPVRSPREGNGNPLQHFCLGNLMDSGVWQAMVQEIAKESDMT